MQLVKYSVWRYVLVIMMQLSVEVIFATRSSLAATRSSLAATRSPIADTKLILCDRHSDVCLFWNYMRCSS